MRESLSGNIYHKYQKGTRVIFISPADGNSHTGFIKEVYYNYTEAYNGEFLCYQVEYAFIRRECDIPQSMIISEEEEKNMIITDSGSIKYRRRKL